MTKYEPTQEEIDYDRFFAITHYPEVYPGVHAEVVHRGDITFVNILWAAKEGSGQVGKYIDTLQGIVIFTSVVSDRLRGMLIRRGYKKYAETGLQKGL